MANIEIFSFRAWVDAYPEDGWRDFEVLSDISLFELGSTMLDAFGSWQYHLWSILYKGVTYEAFEEIAWQCLLLGEPEPIAAKDYILSKLGLRIGSKLCLMYDYGTTWDFTIKLTGRTPYAFPRLVSGKGGDMIEDVSPYEVKDLIDLEKNGKTLRDDEELQERFRKEDWNWSYDSKVKARRLYPLVRPCD